MTAHFGEQGGLLLGFNTLSHHVEVEAPGKLHDAARHGGVTFAGGHAAQKAAVHLERIDGDMPQRGQRRVTAAEGVEGHFDPEVVVAFRESFATILAIKQELGSGGSDA